MFKRKNLEQDVQIQQNTNSSLQTSKQNNRVAIIYCQNAKGKTLSRHSADKQRLFKLQTLKNYPQSVQKDKYGITDQTIEVPESLSKNKSLKPYKISESKANKLKELGQKSRRYNLKIKMEPKNRQIKQSKRIILLDWLSEVSVELGISKQALHQAAYYLDKLVTQITISQHQYQAIGVSCLFLSHKLDKNNSISFSVASNLIEESKTQQWFIEHERKILTLFRFKLQVFTLWQEINMLLLGFQIYFKKQISTLQNWKFYKNRILWTTSGIALKQPYNLNQINQKELCIAIISLVIEKLATEHIILETKFKVFCQTLLKESPYQNVIILKAKIAVWAKFECTCLIPYNPESYHPQLKLLASLS